VSLYGVERVLFIDWIAPLIDLNRRTETVYFRGENGSDWFRISNTVINVSRITEGVAVLLENYTCCADL